MSRGLITISSNLWGNIFHFQLQILGTRLLAMIEIGKLQMLRVIHGFLTVQGVGAPNPHAVQGSTV